MIKGLVIVLTQIEQKSLWSVTKNILVIVVKRQIDNVVLMRIVEGHWLMNQLSPFFAIIFFCKFNK